ncbi:MAG: DUF512 domain-containing protein [Lachnospiraceae bacterium]|nr:DUF512 domain-containing protein [Lachnospiraceae bacterium]
MKKHKIINIEEESIAEELGISPGDYLLAINNKEIEDIFDYQYLINDEYLEVLIETADGEEWLLEIEKEYDEDLGFEFDESLMDSYRSCYNKCVFCFIDQNPPGMRETIYFKDDDTRLSFLQGNYVTLTNMKESDIRRIIDYKLAPINISVHTTNKKLRCQMLNNRFAGNVIEYMDMLYSADIPMNAQIVLCKGMNDGAELEKTIEDLLAYAPTMESLSIVPVGLSKYRDGLCKLESFTKEDAIRVIHTVSKYQDMAMERFGIHFVHASDEWYMNAGLPLPDAENYDGYLQLENGVGMTRLFIDEATCAVEEYLEANNHVLFEGSRTISTISGLLAYDVMMQVADIYNKAAPKVNFQIFPIRNDFFGEKITVTGLLTGRDIVAQLAGKNLGDALIIPSNVLKADENIFLDDMSVDDLQKALQVSVIIVQSSGKELFYRIIEMENKDE